MSRADARRSLDAAPPPRRGLPARADVLDAYTDVVHRTLFGSWPTSTCTTDEADDPEADVRTDHARRDGRGAHGAHDDRARGAARAWRSCSRRHGTCSWNGATTAPASTTSSRRRVCPTGRSTDTSGTRTSSRTCSPPRRCARCRRRSPRYPTSKATAPRRRPRFGAGSGRTTASRERDGMIRVWADAALQDDSLAEDSAAILDWGRRRMVQFLEPRRFGDPELDAIVLLALVDAFGGHERPTRTVDAAVHIIERGFLGPRAHLTSVSSTSVECSGGLESHASSRRRSVERTRPVHRGRSRPARRARVALLARRRERLEARGGRSGAGCGRRSSATSPTKARCDAPSGRPPPSSAASTRSCTRPPSVRWPASSTPMPTHGRACSTRT